MLPKVLPSNRSGVWTVCPSDRSCSAKVVTPPGQAQCVMEQQYFRHGCPDLSESGR